MRRDTGSRPAPKGTARTLVERVGGWKWRLPNGAAFRLSLKGHSVQTDYVWLNEDGVLHLDEGYAWDGASGPAIDTAGILRASAAHDALYQLMREGALPQACRRDADRVLRELCLADGCHPWRAWWVYWAVRLFGGPGARRREPKVRWVP